MQSYTKYELTIPGAKVPENFRSRERKLSVGTFVPRSENTEERKVPEPHLAGYQSVTKIVRNVL